MTLLGTVVSWIGRHLLLLLIVVVAIVAFQHVERALKQFDEAQLSAAALERTAADVRKVWEKRKKDTVHWLRGLETAANSKIEQRISEIDRELVEISNRPEPPIIEVDVGGLGVDTVALKQRALSSATKELLLWEQAVLRAMLDARTKVDNGRRLLDAGNELERRRLEHVQAYEALKQNENAQLELIANDPLLRHFPPYRLAHRRLQELRDKNKQLLKRNKDAHKAYEAQKGRVEVMKKVTERVPPSAVEPDLPDGAAALLRDAESRLRSSLKDNWLGRKLAAIRDDMTRALPMAAAILLGIILTPLAIKTVFYFILAPIASRTSGIALLPQAAGDIETLGNVAREDAARASTVSRAVPLNAGNELLVHEEYVLGIPHESSRRTKPLLSGRYWLASLAAGLYAINCMRSNLPTTVVLTSPRNPHSEIEILALPAGSALVLQARHLVGVLQERQEPLRITSHWRPGSLHAWLTMRLRYLVFHGPVTLIVEGCRGVRIERAEEGRSMNRAATIGFSANLVYSSRRSATFLGYLTGKQPLLNDSFAGSTGKCIYQNMPFSGGRPGMPGRWFDVFTDALLKTIGV